MPRIEFSSHEQADLFVQWLEVKREEHVVERIKDLPAHNLLSQSIYIVDGSPVVIFKGVYDYRLKEVIVSDQAGSELASRGVIFESGKSPHGDLPGGSLKSQSTQVLNAGDQV